MMQSSSIFDSRLARTTFTGGELARVAATTSICFDPSILEIFAPLCTGGAVVLKENALDPFAPDDRPTMLNCVPSALIELCRAGAVPDSVRVINVGGDFDWSNFNGPTCHPNANGYRMIADDIARAVRPLLAP